MRAERAGPGGPRAGEIQARGWHCHSQSCGCWSWGVSPCPPSITWELQQVGRGSQVWGRDTGGSPGAWG